MAEVDDPILEYGTQSPKRWRWHSLIWWLPPVIIGIAAGYIDPLSLRTGDPRYGARYELSDWLFAITFVYILVLPISLFLLRLVRGYRHKRSKVGSTPDLSD